VSEPVNETAEPVAIIGAGAIGMAIGAALYRAGHPITVCGGTPVRAFAVTDHSGTETIPVTHTTEPAEIKEHRLVVLAVKAHQTPAVGDWLRAAADAGTAVLVAQNGIEHRERVEPYLGASSVVPAGVYINSERPRPGVVIVHPVTVEADLVIPDGPAALRFQERLAAGGLKVRADPDFVTVAWQKLLTNLVTNPITALTLRRIEVFQDPAVAEFAVRLLDEGAEVARAAGAVIAPDHARQTVTWLQGFPEGATTSMLRDRIAGAPMEHDAITGAVLRAAGRYGVAVPQLQSLHALVDALDGNRTP
jgi:2-dehydropantoate 2-reductase